VAMTIDTMDEQLAEADSQDEDVSGSHPLTPTVQQFYIRRGSRLSDAENKAQAVLHDCYRDIGRCHKRFDFEMADMWAAHVPRIGELDAEIKALNDEAQELGKVVAEQKSKIARATGVRGKHDPGTPESAQLKEKRDEIASKRTEIKRIKTARGTEEKERGKIEVTKIVEYKDTYGYAEMRQDSEGAFEVLSPSGEMVRAPWFVTPEGEWIGAPEVRTAKGKIARLELRREVALTKLSQYYCGERGVYWGNFSKMRADIATAAKQVVSKRSKGKPAQLRLYGNKFVPFSLQIQRGRNDPKRTPAALADENGFRNSAIVLPHIPQDQWNKMGRAERRRAGRGVVRFRIATTLDGKPIYSYVDSQAWRQLDDDADIATLQLSFRDCGPMTRGFLNVTAKIPAKPRKSGPTVVLHLGWRDDKDGIIVGTWRWMGDGPLPVPERLRPSLKEVLISDAGGRTGVVRLSDRFAANMLREADEIHSERTLAFNAMKEQIVQELTEGAPVPSPFPQERAKDIEFIASRADRWLKPGLWLEALGCWLAEPETMPGFVSILEAWARADRRPWFKESNLRRKAIARRDDAYKNVAALFAEVAGVLIVDDMDISQLARKKKGDDDDEDGRDDNDMVAEQRKQGALHRVDAAPASLRAYCVTAAEREGALPRPVSSLGAYSSTHFADGADNKDVKPVDGVWIHCTAGNHRYHKEHSTTANMLKLAHEEATVRWQLARDNLTEADAKATEAQKIYEAAEAAYQENPDHLALVAAEKAVAARKLEHVQRKQEIANAKLSTKAALAALKEQLKQAREHLAVNRKDAQAKADVEAVKHAIVPATEAVTEAKAVPPPGALDISDLTATINEAKAALKLPNSQRINAFKSALRTADAVAEIEKLIEEDQRLLPQLEAELETLTRK